MMNIRRWLMGGAVALSALTLLTSHSEVANAQKRGKARAAKVVRGAENSLLGIRLNATFSAVLNKYGPPNEIQAGSPRLPGSARPQGGAAGGGMAMAGAGGASGRMAAMSGGGMAGMMGGANMASRMPTGMGGMMGGAPGMGGPPPGMMSGMMQMMRRGQGGAPGGGGLPGFNPGGGGGMASMMGGQAGAGMGAGATAAAQPEEDTSETTWWYHQQEKAQPLKQRKPATHLSFLFNKAGQVIQIQTYGYASPYRTSRGIGLGSSLGAIINAYGWSADSERNGQNMTARFDHGGVKTVFQLSRNKVIGITVARVQ